MKRTGICSVFMSIALTFAMSFNFAGCTGETAEQVTEKAVKSGGSPSVELTAQVKRNNISGKATDEKFTAIQSELYTKLFTKAIEDRKGENVFISPLSLHLALSMAAGGAAGETKGEMEKLLGGGITIDELNEYLYSYYQSLSQGDGYKLSAANSVWLRDDSNRLQAKEDFLQSCADYYGAQVFKGAFDSGTVKDMNSWAAEHTDNLIEKAVEELDSETLMVLMNAAVFDAQWEEPYDRNSIVSDSFTSVSGKVRNVQMMCSQESLYLTDGKAVGFIKNYKGGKYAFAALLPEKGEDIYEYAMSLKGERLKEILSNAQYADMLRVKLPKFSAEYDMSFKDALSEMGMKTVFDSAKADLTNMAISPDGNIFIGDVLHKTYICVDELGTKAGAVTVVATIGSAAPTERKEVFLDRPFVCMILDRENNVPVFMGVLGDIK